MAAGGEIWAELQEAFGPLGSKPRPAMVAGLAAHQFGMVIGVAGIDRPDIQRVADSELVVEPDVAVEVFDLRAGHVDHSRVGQPGASFESMLCGLPRLVADVGEFRLTKRST